MSDQDHPQDPEHRDPPASVAFLAMMRQHAADQQPHIEEEEIAPPASVEPDAEPEADVPPMSEAEKRRLAALEAQRVRRVQRRQSNRKQKRAGMMSGVIFSWFIVIVTGGLIATILSWSTSPDSLSLELRSQISQYEEGGRGPQSVVVDESGAVILPTIQPTPNYMIRIGIISGHMGPENDPGAVCDEDGLTEAEINFAVADRVARTLRDRGYVVDLLEEFDVRLENYQANLLVSIHANDCSDYGGASGYLISKAEDRPDDGEDVRLMECVGAAYGTATNLERRYGLTRDMTDYHIFREIDINTPGVILELGFMRDDREILTTQQDLLAGAVIQGIECFLRPPQPGFSTPAPQPTPTDIQE